jgi:hypothetical protein
VTALRRITLLFLGLLSVGGFAGGAAFLIDRTGGRLGMTVDELPSWPLLGDYTVPGVALVLLFGVLPLLAGVWLVRRSPGGWGLTTAVGLLLVGWMAAQILAMGLPFPAVQVGFLILGIGLTGLGVDGGATAAADESRTVAPS